MNPFSTKSIDIFSPNNGDLYNLTYNYGRQSLRPNLISNEKVAAQETLSKSYLRVTIHLYFDNIGIYLPLSFRSNTRIFLSFVIWR